MHQMVHMDRIEILKTGADPAMKCLPAKLLVASSVLVSG